MNNLWELVGFEYKKIFKSKMNVIFLGLALFISIITVLLNVYGGSYYSGIGNDISKSQALKMDKEIINQNKGNVDEQMLKQMIILAQEGFGNKENYFYNNEGKLVLKSESKVDFVLPYNNIYRFLNNVYDDKIEILGHEKPIQHLNSEDMEDFYNIYKGFLSENINSNHQLTNNEKQKHLNMISQIETPFYNEYAGGWLSIRNLLPMIGILILTAIAIVTANIFGKEYSSKTDAVILSTKSGKSKLILAKIVTVISFSTSTCLVLSLAHVVSYFVTHGLDGFNVPLQFLSGFEYSTYPITISEFALICLLVFLAVSISFGCFCAMISAVCKNSITALSILFLSILVPIFIPPMEDRLLAQVMDLLFARTLNHGTIFSEYFYTFGNISFTPFVFYCIASAIGCAIFLPLAYRGFKNHQVG